jgi:hypothetical protein
MSYDQVRGDVLGGHNKAHSLLASLKKAVPEIGIWNLGVMWNVMLCSPKSLRIQFRRGKFTHPIGFTDPIFTFQAAQQKHQKNIIKKTGVHQRPVVFFVPESFLQQPGQEWWKT